MGQAAPAHHHHHHTTPPGSKATGCTACGSLAVPLTSMSRPTACYLSSGPQTEEKKVCCRLHTFRPFILTGPLSDMFWEKTSNHGPGHHHQPHH